MVLKRIYFSFWLLLNLSFWYFLIHYFIQPMRFHIPPFLTSNDLLTSSIAQPAVILSGYQNSVVKLCSLIIFKAMNCTFFVYKYRAHSFFIPIANKIVVINIIFKYFQTSKVSQSLFFQKILKVKLQKDGVWCAICEISWRVPFLGEVPGKWGRELGRTGRCSLL